MASPSSPLRVGVVGAGLAGLQCARVLRERGADVTVLDKGRSIGGRTSARRVEGHTFDLGAQYFTVHDERFGHWVREAAARGICAPWTGRIVALDPRDGTQQPTEPQERLVGTPDMNALARALGTDLAIRTSHRVERISPHDGAWRLSGTVASGVTLGPLRAEPGAAHLGTFDALAICVPAPQAVPLLEPVSSSLADVARRCTFDPCFALGIVTEGRWRVPFDGAFVGRDGDGSSALSFLARDSSKPRRPAGERWLVHASTTFSRAHFESGHGEVTTLLLAEFARLLAIDPIVPSMTTLQRWSLARAQQPAAQPSTWDAATRIGLAGDWTHGGRVEGAFLSGHELAGRILDGT